MELPYLLPGEPGHVTFPAHPCSPTRDSSEPQHQDILLGFHWEGMTDWIIGHMIELSLQLF